MTWGGIASGVGAVAGGLLSSSGAPSTGHNRYAYYNPSNINTSGGSVSSTQGYFPTKKERKRGMMPTPGTVTANQSPEMAKFRQALLDAGMGQLGQQGKGVPGFAGITPEMFQEFMMANNNQGQDWMNQSRGYLDQERAMGPYDFQGTYNDRLANMRAQDQPREDRLRYNNWDNQFGRGILDSTGGQYQTQGVEEAFGNQDLRRHDTAFGQAMGLGDQYNQIRQMLQSAGLNFGQAGQGQVADRFARANEMFGTGQQAETLGAQRGLGYLGGVGGMDQFLANLMQMQSNQGSQQSAANAGTTYQNPGNPGQSDFLGQMMSQFMNSLPTRSPTGGTKSPTGGNSPTGGI
jgi:hypothetical protein